MPLYSTTGKLFAIGKFLLSRNTVWGKDRNRGKTVHMTSKKAKKELNRLIKSNRTLDRKKHQMHQSSSFKSPERKLALVIAGKDTPTPTKYSPNYSAVFANRPNITFSPLRSNLHNSTEKSFERSTSVVKPSKKLPKSLLTNNWRGKGVLKFDRHTIERMPSTPVTY